MLLLVLPIAFVAVRWGRRAALAAAMVAIGLTALRAWQEQLSIPPLGFLTRASAFLTVALMGGTQAAIRGEAFGRDTEEFRPERLESLTARELEILRLIAAGMTNADIADTLVVSENTVKSHVKRIFTKLGAGNRTQAALAYLRGPQASDPGEEPRNHPYG